MDYETLLKLMEEYAAAQQALENEINSKLYGFIERAAINFLIENPMVECVHWTQFTPYFNDGDACVFSINGPAFTLKGEEIELGESSTIYTEADYEKAKQYLVDAIAYFENPTEWIEKYLEEYKAKYGIKYPLPKQYVRPVYLKEDAVSYINDISRFLEETDVKSRTKIQTSFDNFCTLFSKFQDSSYRSAYGDHSSVVITREGTTIDVYDHD